MMKSIIYNIKVCAIAMVALLVATSCLEKYPGGAIETSKSLKTYDDAVQFNTGIYAMLKSSSLYTGYLTTLPDVQTDLVYAVDGYSNQLGSFWLWQIRSTTSESEAVYANLYSVISNCNFFLENIGVVKANTTDDNKLSDLDYFTGEVYAIRALAYSELIKLYCKAYNPATAKEELGIVLRKHYSKPEEAKRASLYDSYEFVLEDLAKAEELLDSEYDGYGAIYTTKAMAEALHARVALYMQDWDTAVEYATKLIESERFALSSVNNMISSSTSHFKHLWANDEGWEIIWQINLSPESYGGMLGSPFLGRNTDGVNYYPDYVPAQWVLNLYDANDLRYNAYFANAQTAHSHGLVWPLLIKYAGNTSFINSYLLYEVSMPKPFRLAEQYLIRAEAYCRQATPNYSAASADLTKLREARYVSGKGAMSVTADNWLENIANERVRELYMEGHRLQDLKRWGDKYNEGKGFTRTPQTNSLKEGSSIKKSADDYMFVWPIPRHEVEAPGSQVQQNEGY
uniref:RagB/SusD family nutrient uptake outer membrane protein n=1 Tax=Alistipes sp. TaxID=1872444 RepID=UPI004056AEB5